MTWKLFPPRRSGRPARRGRGSYRPGLDLLEPRVLLDHHAITVPAPIQTDIPEWWVDTDISGNDATTVESIQRCRRFGSAGVGVIEMFQVDVVVFNVNDLAGFEFDFHFDDTAVSFAGADANYLLTSNGSVLGHFGAFLIDSNTVSVTAHLDETVGGPASGSGVLIEESANNEVGANTATPGTGPDNVISGNGANGVQIRGSEATGNGVRGNLIGLNAAGTAARGNGLSGVRIDGASLNTVGGEAVEARNVISGQDGSAGYGVELFGAGATGNRVQGNFIGTNLAGTAALENAYGVYITTFASDNLIGGAAAAPGSPPGNLIAGNRWDGVHIRDNATRNLVQGNLIGTNATGTAALANTSGVAVRFASDNTIGGAASGTGNVISGNSSFGVFIDTASRNLIRGNFIGTRIDGTNPLGNGAQGVFVLDSDSTQNRIARNAISFNAGLGIDRSNNLPSDGVTPNDAGDGDPGANNLQNYPGLALATASGGTTTVTGTLNSIASTAFTLEFFASDACDPSGHGEGKVFLGERTETTKGSGDASFTISLPLVIAGWFITATATDPDGNTSEVAACVEVTAGGGGGGGGGDEGRRVPKAAGAPRTQEPASQPHLVISAGIDLISAESPRLLAMLPTTSAVPSRRPDPLEYLQAATPGSFRPLPSVSHRWFRQRMNAVTGVDVVFARPEWMGLGELEEGRGAPIEEGAGDESGNLDCELPYTQRGES
jgi:hypothetical protein